MKCTHCSSPMDLVREVEDNARGIVTLKDYLCPRCGSTATTRQPRHQAEVVTTTTEPRAATDARETAQMEREAHGQELFHSAGGRRHVKSS